MTKKITKKTYNFLGENYVLSRKNKYGSNYFYNENLEMPSTLKLLGDVKNKKILDLGCGPGLYAKTLLNKGAKIKGIDISEKMIKIAKKEAPKAEFKQGDSENLPYKNNEFDIVVASLVLGHIKSWDKTLEEIKRVLKKRGIFVFSIHNPVTEKSTKKKWFFKKFRIIKNYFEEDAIIRKYKGGDKNKIEAIHYHKTYTTVIRNLLKHNFEIIDYEDCKPNPKLNKQYPKLYKKTCNAPHFCVWKLKKN